MSENNRDRSGRSFSDETGWFFQDTLNNGTSMTVREAAASGSAELTRAGIESPFLDALLLLGEATGLTKERLFTAYTSPVPEDRLERYRSLIARRAAGAPVSYLLRRREFYGREFYVDERVLVPRPETEILVERAHEILRTHPEIVRVHDLCTGSGCIAVTLASLHPDREISASDISTGALEVMRKNSAAILGRELPWFESDLLRDVPGRFGLITANPPYIERSDLEAMIAGGLDEPVLALDGGPDGLDVVRRLVTEAIASLDVKGYLLFEIAYNQADRVTDELVRAGFTDIAIERDLGDRDRVVLGRKGE
jgi:release factor glutamine methyltransferase